MRVQPVDAARQVLLLVVDGDDDVEHRVALRGTQVLPGRQGARRAVGAGGDNHGDDPGRRP
ncbi:hypothetical protein GCM10022245_74750 [Streptomyces mayteni]